MQGCLRGCGPPARRRAVFEAAAASAAACELVANVVAATWAGGLWGWANGWVRWWRRGEVRVKVGGVVGEVWRRWGCEGAGGYVVGKVAMKVGGGREDVRMKA